MSYVETNTFWEVVAKAMNIKKKLMNYGEITHEKEMLNDGHNRTTIKQGFQFTYL